MEAISFKRIIKISRFPHFWIWSAGFLSWGAMLAVGKEAFQSPVFYILFLWFIFPANLFLNAINDAFDYETDIKNPRKQSLESTVSKNGKKKMLLISLIALVSVFFIFPFVSLLVIKLILIWIAIVFAYNVPPIRFKQYPIVDILFGGTGHYVMMLIIGYVSMSEVFPPLKFIVLGMIFMAAGHCLGESLDAPYDTAAGIKNTTARLGTIKRGLVFSAFIFLASAVYGLFIGWPLFSIFVLIFPAIIFYNILKENMEARSVLIFKEFIWASAGFGFIIGTFLYWS